MTLDLSAVDLPTETLHTERLVLRPYRPDDVDAVHRACQDPAIQRWLPMVPVPYTEEDARTFVEEVALAERATGSVLSCAVEAGGSFAGTAALRLGTGELGPAVGYWIAPEARGRGLLSEATRRVTSYAEDGLVDSLLIRAAAGNAASRRVATNAGYREVGVLPRCEPLGDGTLADLVLYARP